MDVWTWLRDDWYLPEAVRWTWIAMFCPGCVLAGETYRGMPCRPHRKSGWFAQVSWVSRGVGQWCC
jgi:hypothetical protein